MNDYRPAKNPHVVTLDGWVTNTHWLATFDLLKARGILRSPRGIMLRDGAVRSEAGTLVERWQLVETMRQAVDEILSATDAVVAPAAQFMVEQAIEDEGFVRVTSEQRVRRFIFDFAVDRLHATHFIYAPSCTWGVVALVHHGDDFYSGAIVIGTVE